MNRYILSVTLVISLSFTQAIAQDRDTTSYTSGDLISTYYEDGFRPFQKGVTFTKLSFSLSDQDLQNVSRLFDKVVDGKDFSWSIDLSGGHFVGDYFLVGAVFSFSETRFTGELVDSNSDTINTQSITRNFNVGPYIRVAIPLTANQRLSFYNDLGIGVGFGRSLSRDTMNQDEIQKQYGEQFLFGIGLTPGITYFAVENVALEVGINLIGYQLNIENLEDGDGVESRKVEHDVSFRINLLSLNLGIAYFFGTKK